MIPFAEFEEPDYYRDHFSDVAVWEPYVTKALKRTLDVRVETVSAARPAGSFPVFVANDLFVIKFFGRLLDGGRSFEAETAFARAFSAGDFPAPVPLASGELFPLGSCWPWPFLIYPYLNGQSFCAVRSKLSPEQAAAAIRWAGQQAGLLHNLSPADEPLFPPNWDSYLAFLEKQAAGCPSRQLQRGSLPRHLIKQIPDFLLPVQQLFAPGEKPHWIHADLTCEHLVGRSGDQGWTPEMLIDFGDGMTGSVYYELAAVGLGLCAANPAWIAAFLDGLGTGLRSDPLFARKATCTALCHGFDVFAGLAQCRPELLAASSLEEFSRRLWLG